MCMLTLSALRLTKRGTGSPLAEPADWASAGPAPMVPALAAKITTSRARQACFMRDAQNQFECYGRSPGAFVLTRPSGTEGTRTSLAHPHRNGLSASVAEPG